MNPHNVLDECKAVIGERGKDYGGVEQNFESIAAIYSRVSGIHIEAHDIALMMVCLKLARIRSSPMKRDNYLDLINYAAFACELMGAQ
jgi:hypothetical protein